ncbi:hypothetical protein XH83_18095 [Bradyrhizobium sp. CCBAU 53351]|uniref:hypothetical protein n=1 Tax=Bradyrhizobium sp. CCBAU 53351 TaxID=1325114 RepID=UPI001886D6CE|nr:hypothetical protein [Bradyrhizobium sp. CCBAU 53351]QOZ77194.1 hypothetical protein XH83_18095 [Bradyrhizobium sp. CCBAU 53351]
MGSNSWGADKVGSIDVFGTYLNEIRGSTLMERILDLTTHKGALPISILVKHLDGNPQEVVSALMKAEELGYVRLEKQADETMVIPLTK